MLRSFSIFNIEVQTFPLIIMLAVSVCVFYYLLSKKFDMVFSVAFFRFLPVILLGAAIGGRLFYAVVLWLNCGDPIIHNIFFGGSVFYGGLMGGALALLVACKIKKILFLAFADAYISILPLGHSIARIGCFLNGCCYGKDYEGLFSIKYPIGDKWIGIFPTWFFEAFFLFVLFLGMNYVIETKITGVRTAIYLISYSVFRFGIEFMRGDTVRGIWLNLSTSQWISIIILPIGFAILIRSRKENMLNYMFA